MNVEISKNELAGALSALGKLVCRTSPVEAYRSLRIEGKENKIDNVRKIAHNLRKGT